MLAINMVEEEIREPPRFREDEGTYTLVLRLHGFDGEYTPHILKIVWKEGGNEITIKGSRDSLEEIKRYLIRRDKPISVIWSIMQYEYRTLDRIEDKVERLQNASLHSYSSKLLHDILRVKKTLFILHRDYMRIRNILEWAVSRGNMDASELLRDINELIYDVEYLIDGSTTAIQLMQNTLSVKMNEVMKILTVIATIMMPLTLITGIYGMNFKNMPELQWEYGYYFSLLLMLIIAAGMIIYFRRRGII